MFAERSYKEGVIYSKTRGTIYARLEFTLSSQDEVVYEALKEIKNLIGDPKALIKISYVQDKLTDKKPEAPAASTEEEKIIDSKLIVKKFKYVIDNMIFKDEAFYGKKFDGQNREYRILWKDKDGTEYFVPLEGFDTFEAKNPHGAFSYNSETRELMFSKIVAEDVEYILRRYKVND